MTLEEIRDNAEDQERGRICHVVSPFDGTRTGISLRIVGPDSRTARNSRLQLEDELREAADKDGLVTAQGREDLVIQSLARLVLDVTADETAGQPFSLSHGNVVKLLRTSWIREQADAFAGDRRNFAPGSAR